MLCAYFITKLFVAHIRFIFNAHFCVELWLTEFLNIKRLWIVHAKNWALKSACERSKGQWCAQFIAKSLLSLHFGRIGDVQKASDTSRGATATLRRTGVVTRAISYNNNSNNNF